MLQDIKESSLNWSPEKYLLLLLSNALLASWPHSIPQDREGYSYNRAYQAGGSVQLDKYPTTSERNVLRQSTKVSV